MLIERLFSKKDTMVEKTLDALALRIQAQSNNLANVNTPGYVRQEVSFEDAVREAYEASRKHRAVDGSEPSPIDSFAPLMRKEAAPQRIDGNTVSPETEMTAMVETAIAYNALVRQTGFSTLKTIIQNGK